MHKCGIMVICLAGMIASAVLVEETRSVYLSGYNRDDPVSWEFYCTAGRNSGKWTTIGAPSNWERKGFGNSNYGNDKKKAAGTHRGTVWFHFGD